MASNQAKQILQNIAREKKAMDTRVRAGLWEAGLKLQAASQKRVPVHTGNLKASAYTRREPSGKPAVEVGYTAAYAVWVHENVGQKLKGKPRPRHGYQGSQGRYWDPQGRAGPKFLTGALDDNRKAIRDIIAFHARVR